eukprot:CAMPEP_0170591452 /NCGR_PEP_ID=MMETSP0224-20130122/12413_1 /TAXON_ID=285029 /ORGANISM="Togula jolla, Strain CCCM 725" /LENGTH=585 /DNA_ID=CAMNT_0010915321 /DNA_START=72 /DNA_END=1829 /DNA_ORIENTATION=+
MRLVFVLCLACQGAADSPASDADVGEACAKEDVDALHLLAMRKNQISDIGDDGTLGNDRTMGDDPRMVHDPRMGTGDAQLDQVLAAGTGTIIEDASEPCNDADGDCVTVCYNSGFDFGFGGRFMPNNGEKLTNPANFGPSGTYKTKMKLVAIALSDVGKDALVNNKCDIFQLGLSIADAVANPPSDLRADQYAGLKEWSSEDCSRVLLASQMTASLWDAQYAVSQGAWNPMKLTELGNRVLKGPFGVTHGFNQGGYWMGYFNKLPPADKYCTLITTASGASQPVALIDKASNDIFFSDCGILSSLGGVSLSSAIYTNNDVLYANLYTFMINLVKQGTCNACEYAEEIESADDVPETTPTTTTEPPTTTTTTTTPDCSEILTLNPLVAVQSNLGGLGPDSGPEEIRYEAAATVKRQSVDLVVTASSDYQAQSTAQNGVFGKFGQINVKYGTSVDLKFQYVLSGTDTPVKVNKFALTVYDIDHQSAEKAEIIKVCGVVGASTFPTTSVEEIEAGPGCKSFKSTKTSGAENNPNDPEVALTDEQKENSASFYFDQPTSEFIVTMAVDGKVRPSGRNFMFAGVPAIPCL